jgi:hypothetical protein
MRPDVIRCHLVIGRQVFCALAGSDDLETTGARPINKFAGQRRLVAVGERIDDAFRPRFFDQQRPRQHVSFDVDHDDVLLRGYRGAGMGDTGRRVAGRLDDDLDLGIGTGVAAIRDEPRTRELRLVPADRMARLAGALLVKIGDDRDFDAGHRRRLVQKHRAELAGADQPDPHRPPGRGAPLRQLVKAHRNYSAASR